MTASSSSPLRYPVPKAEHCYMRMRWRQRQPQPSLHTQRHAHPGGVTSPTPALCSWGRLPQSLSYTSVKWGKKNPTLPRCLNGMMGGKPPAPAWGLQQKVASSSSCAARRQDITSQGLFIQGLSLSGHRGEAGPFEPRPSSDNKDGESTYTWPVSWATTNAEEKPSSWFRVQLRTGWHIPVTGA